MFLSSQTPLPVSAAISSPGSLPANLAAEIIRDPSKIQIPFEYCTVKEMHSAKSGSTSGGKGQNSKLFILIEDAHANYSGQMSLAGILNHFMTHHGMSLVLSEGSSKDSTLDEVRKIADSKTWKIAAKRFLMDGVLKGEEYLNLTSDHPMKIRGIEYSDLYDKSLVAYSRIVKKREKILAYIHRIRKVLDRLKNKLYTKDVLVYEEAKKKSGAADGSAGVSLDLLLDLSDKAKIDYTRYPEIRELRSLKAREKLIDFKKANREQAALLESLRTKGFESEVKRSLESSKKTRSLQMAQRSILKELFVLAQKKGINTRGYPALLKYMDYLEAFSELRLNLLLSETETLEDETYKNLLPEKDPRKLRAIERFVDLLDKAYNLRLSSDDFQSLKLNEPDFKTESWEAYLNGKLLDFKYFEDLLPYEPLFERAWFHLKRFYSLVQERDLAFMENGDRIMAQTKQNAAFMIAGGYHTANLTRLMREKGVSYVVLTPVVTQETNHREYEKLLLMPLNLAQRNLVGSNPPPAQSEPDNNLNTHSTLRGAALGTLEGMTTFFQHYGGPAGVPIVDGARMLVILDSMVRQESGKNRMAQGARMTQFEPRSFSSHGYVATYYSDGNGLMIVKKIAGLEIVHGAATTEFDAFIDGLIKVVDPSDWALMIDWNHCEAFESWEDAHDYFLKKRWLNSGKRTNFYCVLRDNELTRRADQLNQRVVTSLNQGFLPEMIENRDAPVPFVSVFGLAAGVPPRVYGMPTRIDSSQEVKWFKPWTDTASGTAMSTWLFSRSIGVKDTVTDDELLRRTRHVVLMVKLGTDTPTVALNEMDLIIAPNKLRGVLDQVLTSSMKPEIILSDTAQSAGPLDIRVLWNQYDAWISDFARKRGATTLSVYAVRVYSKEETYSVDTKNRFSFIEIPDGARLGQSSADEDIQAHEPGALGNNLATLAEAKPSYWLGGPDSALVILLKPKAECAIQAGESVTDKLTRFAAEQGLQETDIVLTCSYDVRDKFLSIRLVAAPLSELLKENERPLVRYTTDFDESLREGHQRPCFFEQSIHFDLHNPIPEVTFDSFYVDPVYRRGAAISMMLETQRQIIANHFNQCNVKTKTANVYVLRKLATLYNGDLDFSTDGRGSNGANQLLFPLERLELFDANEVQQIRAQAEAAHQSITRAIVYSALQGKWRDFGSGSTLGAVLKHLTRVAKTRSWHFVEQELLATEGFWCVGHLMHPQAHDTPRNQTGARFAQVLGLTGQAGLFVESATGFTVDLQRYLVPVNHPFARFGSWAFGDWRDWRETCAPTSFLSVDVFKPQRSDALPSLEAVQSAYRGIAGNLDGRSASASPVTYELAVEAPKGMGARLSQWAKALNRQGDHVTVRVSVFDNGSTPEFLAKGPNVRRLAIFTGASGKNIPRTIIDGLAGRSGYLAYTVADTTDPEMLHKAFYTMAAFGLVLESASDAASAPATMRDFHMSLTDLFQGFVDDSLLSKMHTLPGNAQEAHRAVRTISISHPFKLKALVAAILEAGARLSKTTQVSA